MDETERLAKILRTASDRARFDELMVRDCLKELKAVVMTKDILNSTKIGIIVSKVKRDCKLGETQQLAKALLADWRAQVGLQDSKAARNAKNNKSSVKGDDGALKSPLPRGSDGKAAQTVLEPHHRCDDPVRNKFRELLCKKLSASIKPEDTANAGMVAADIENACFIKHSDSASEDYRALTRSRIQYCKDWIRGALMQEVMAPEEFVKLSGSALLSKEQQDVLQKDLEKASHDRALAVAEGASTDQLVCPRCKARDASYTEVQTRSADEPMTIFASCKKCGKRWRA
ncbi:uncharacterized protein MONBRDRAFT_38572 [Monosiga brevicollis MX1]|uniref:Transcription elongation factor S-II n=1 Tax=Monosiga brevicollis TaxID=81824 RepID=A9V8U5_MONBE|nr:uncharacterized protein MONBRDRAFT_38572 [Monosiga brevicollis MX1]EDQ86021.1 predicted protein [Monosiga brevicollis MX1]|eukprot:XP_001749215.1 hypothetical protein [Monosiga brevicollis MX1]